MNKSLLLLTAIVFAGNIAQAATTDVETQILTLQEVAQFLRLPVEKVSEMTAEQIKELLAAPRLPVVVDPKNFPAAPFTFMEKVGNSYNAFKAYVATSKFGQAVATRTPELISKNLGKIGIGAAVVVAAGVAAGVAYKKGYFGKLKAKFSPTPVVAQPAAPAVTVLTAEQVNNAKSFVELQTLITSYALTDARYAKVLAEIKSQINSTDAFDLKRVKIQINLIK